MHVAEHTQLPDRLELSPPEVAYILDLHIASSNNSHEERPYTHVTVTSDEEEQSKKREVFTANLNSKLTELTDAPVDKIESIDKKLQQTQLEQEELHRRRENLIRDQNRIIQKSVQDISTIPSTPEKPPLHARPKITNQNYRHSMPNLLLNENYVSIPPAVSERQMEGERVVDEKRKPFVSEEHTHTAQPLRVPQPSDDNEYDLAVIPPDPSALTDEEEGADEDMAACLIPQDVPGTIEVFMNREGSGDEDSVYDRHRTRSIYSEPKISEVLRFERELLQLEQEELHRRRENLIRDQNRIIQKSVRDISTIPSTPEKPPLHARPKITNQNYRHSMPNLLLNENYVSIPPAVSERQIEGEGVVDEKRKPFVSEEHMQRHFGVEESRRLLYEGKDFRRQPLRVPQPVLPPKPKSRESTEREITMRLVFNYFICSV
ncbi:unnamed protein product [Arctia plantaginis]|uniref:Uncharacterized protein n=1 Tax=Arctia plantaginis TaxID=874455 RepID=A0A8S1B641_ARCPL|nr:unnamed protein product [Arctia plantaginis]